MLGLPESWIVRGDYRMDPGTTEVQQKLRSGSWAPMDWASDFYDPAGAGTNERLQLAHWFRSAPESVPISQARTWSAANGFVEPDRSGGDSFFDDLLPIAALAAGVYFGGAALGAWGGAGEAAAASSLASADAMAGIGASAWAAPTAATVSPATWAAFGNTASTADLYAAATQSAINTSVADYAAAAVTGESVGAMSAFSSGLPLSSLSGAVASPGFFSGALDAVSSIAKGGKQAVDAVRLVNAATGQNTIVPKNAPVPAGWIIDRQWTPPAIMPGAAAQQDQAMNTAPTPLDPGIVAGEASIAPYLVLAASLFFAVAYFGK